MAPPTTSRAVLAVAAAVLLVAAAAAQAPPDAECAGAVGECAAAAGGGGEARRRELGGNSYIGYDALRRNSVPCSVRGQSYYNCQAGAPANPYSRGCSAITQCRG